MASNRIYSFCGRIARALQSDSEFAYYVMTRKRHRLDTQVATESSCIVSAHGTGWAAVHRWMPSLCLWRPVILAAQNICEILSVRVVLTFKLKRTCLNCGTFLRAPVCIHIAGSIPWTAAGARRVLYQTYGISLQVGKTI